MTRVLKPGGKLIVACWCQRETPPKFSRDERSRLQFLYDEWSHPFFISIEQFARFMKGTGRLERVSGTGFAFYFDDLDTASTTEMEDLCGVLFCLILSRLSDSD
mmetsp:Transcript_40595/g.161007  ORF Transcript_40595/g.161007 Transcript_40595/m.161007 type:complete len:104 (+) Transcript_40595:983-1294(+)